MLSEAARAWLDAREPPPPAGLHSRLEGDLGGVGALPELLTEAALRRLRAARERPDERAAAFELLAADALLTYACEAAVDPPARDRISGEGAASTEDRLRRILRCFTAPKG